MKTIEMTTGAATRRARRPSAGALAALLGCVLLAADAGASQRPERAEERGALLYDIHCANCHGESGSGDGPLADVLTEEPTDLTRLSRSAGGDFPTDEVRRSIDGRDAVLGHGRREMPVWGLTFQERGRDLDQEADVRGRIDDLLAFLRSIQEKEAAGDGDETGEEQTPPEPNGPER